MKNNEVVNKSYNRIIIDTFIEKKAINKKSSLTLTDLNIPVPENEKNFLIENFIKDGYIVREQDNSMWFDKAKWDKAVRKISTTYFMILIVPLAIVTLLMLIINILK